jgi:uncharacterized protein YoxC
MPQHHHLEHSRRSLASLLDVSSLVVFAGLILTTSQHNGANAQIIDNATAGPVQQSLQQPANSGQLLQSQLNQIQQQAQRQLNQLNGLVMNAVNNNSTAKYSNVFEAISSVGKAIQQQISAAANPNHVNIVTSNAGNGGATNMPQYGSELANNKKVSTSS